MTINATEARTKERVRIGKIFPGRTNDMAPYRLAAGGSAGASAAIPAVGGGVLGAIAAAWHPSVTIGLGVLLILQFVDIVTGMAAAKRDGQYDQQRASRALWDKLIRDAQIIVALLMDVLLISSGASTLFVLTTGAIGFMVAKEAWSVLGNIQRSQGPDAVWEGFRKVKPLAPAARPPEDGA